MNLERALRMGDTLDGHQVQGHVDGTGSVLGVFTDDGWRVRVGLDAEMMRYMIPKGSVCLDGVSLTIAALDTDCGMDRGGADPRDPRSDEPARSEGGGWDQC